MLAMSKEIRINVRTTQEIKKGLEITAKLRGLSVSALVNSLVVKAIREEKDREPQAFSKRAKHSAAFEKEIKSPTGRRGSNDKTGTDD